jgi:amidase
LAITESTAVDLVSEMAAGKLTSVAVTTAFCKRAALAHQLVCFPILTWNEKMTD